MRNSGTKSYPGVNGEREKDHIFSVVEFAIDVITVDESCGAGVEGLCISSKLFATLMSSKDCCLH